MDLRLTNIDNKENDLSFTQELDRTKIDIFFSQHKRKYQEDSFIVKQFPTFLLAAIADGMGGHAHGDKASQETISMLETLLADTEPTEELLFNIIDQINEKIENYPDGRGTTLTGVIIKEQDIIVFNVGDSYTQLLGEETKITTKPHEDFRTGGLISCIGFLTECLVTTISKSKIDVISIYSDGLEGISKKMIDSYLKTKNKLVFYTLSSDNQTLIHIQL